MRCSRGGLTPSVMLVNGRGGCGSSGSGALTSVVGCKWDAICRRRNIPCIGFSQPGLSHEPRKALLSRPPHLACDLHLSFSFIRRDTCQLRNRRPVALSGLWQF
jgi:hypothetical protein